MFVGRGEEVYWPSPPFEAEGSQEPPSRPVSPANSILSLTPSAFAGCFKYLPEYGRTYNTRGNTYHLPADDGEIERLSKNHVAIKGIADLVVLLTDLKHRSLRLLLGSNYCGPVQDVLRDDPHQGPKAILDLGLVQLYHKWLNGSMALTFRREPFRCGTAKWSGPLSSPLFEEALLNLRLL